MPRDRMKKLSHMATDVPTTEELDEVHGLPRIELTSKARWVPQEHYDEDDPIVVPLTNNAVMAQNVVNDDVIEHDDTRGEKYIIDSIKLFNEEITASPNTAAHRNLLLVNPDSPLLTKDKQACFQQIVVKLFYVSKRTRPDIQEPITFLHALLIRDVRHTGTL